MMQLVVPPSRPQQSQIAYASDIVIVFKNAVRRFPAILFFRVMELFNSQEIHDGISVPRERDQAGAGWVKDIFVNFSSLEVPTDLFFEWLHKESTCIPNYTLQTK